MSAPMGWASLGQNVYIPSGQGCNIYTPGGGVSRKWQFTNAGGLIFSNAAKAEGLQIFNTADEAVNYERFSIRWSANQTRIMSESAGGGTKRSMILETDGPALRIGSTDAATPSVWDFTAGAFVPIVNNTYSLGAPGSVALGVYFGTRCRGSSGAEYSLYNTVDEVTNYERLRICWDANLCKIQTEKGGGGTTRSLYLIGANQLNLGAGGAVKWSITTSYLAPALALDNAIDIGVAGTNRIASFYFGTKIRGSSGAEYSLHNVADETTNYERLRIFWETNVAKISVEKGAAGVDRSLQIISHNLLSFYSGARGWGIANAATCHFYPLTDATYNLGILANRINDVFMAGVLRYDKATLATIGADGAAAALTAHPVGYAVFNFGGTEYQVPYYNKA